MNRLNQNRRRSGYVLMMVLVLVLVLTLLTSRLLQTSYFDTYAMTATQMQSQAVLNGTMGIQEGLARLRSGQIIVGGLPFCQTALGCPPTPPALVLRDNTDNKLSRYSVTIFLKSRGADFNNGRPSSSTSKIVVVSAEGYAYNGLGEANRAFSSLTEVEVAMPQGGGGIPGSGDPVGNSFGGGG